MGMANTDTLTLEELDNQVERFMGDGMFPVYHHAMEMIHRLSRNEGLLKNHLIHAMNERHDPYKASVWHSDDVWRLRFAGLFTPYDEGLLGLTSLSNEEVIDMMDHDLILYHPGPYDYNALATAVLMSRELHHLPSDDFVSAAGPVCSGLLGDWKTCAAIADDYPWVLPLINGRDGGSDVASDCSLYIDDRPHGERVLAMLHDVVGDVAMDSWDDCIGAFVHRLRGDGMDINHRFLMFGYQYIRKAFMQCLEDADATHDYGVFMRTMVCIGAAIKRTHGDDVMVVSEHEFIESLLCAHDYPVEYSAELLMTEALSVWSS